MYTILRIADSGATPMQVQRLQMQLRTLNEQQIVAGNAAARDLQSMLEQSHEQANSLKHELLQVHQDRESLQAEVSQLQQR